MNPAMNLDLNIQIPTYGEPDAEGVLPVTGYVPGLHMNLDINIIIPTYGPPDAEGVRPVTGYVEGYHVNTTTMDLAEHPELEPFVVVPSTMRRVWAGDDPENPQWTVALKFADEAEARAVLGPGEP